MEKYIPIIYDIAIVVMIFFYIRTRYRAGFLSSIIHLAGNIASFIAAYTLSPIISTFIYDNFMKDKIISMLKENINGDNIVTGVNSFIETLPTPISNAIAFLFSKSESLSQKVGESASAGADSMVNTMAESVMKPTVVSLLQVIVFFILFAVCMFVIHRLASLMKGIRHIPLVGSVNGILGAVLGAAEGIIIAALLTILLSYVIVLTNGAIPYVSNELAENSTVFKILDSLKLNLLGSFMK